MIQDMNYVGVPNVGKYKTIKYHRW